MREIVFAHPSALVDQLEDSEHGLPHADRSQRHLDGKPFAEKPATQPGSGLLTYVARPVTRACNPVIEPGVGEERIRIGDIETLGQGRAAAEYSPAGRGAGKPATRAPSLRRSERDRVHCARSETETRTTPRWRGRRPAPPQPRPARASDLQNDLADMPGAFDPLVRLGGVFQRELAVHHRTDPAGIEQRPDLGLQFRGDPRFRQGRLRAQG